MNIGRNGRAPPALPASVGTGAPPPLRDPAGVIARALTRPLGSPALDRFVEPGDRVAVLQGTALPPALRTLAAECVATALERAGASEVVRIEVPAGPASLLSAPSAPETSPGAQAAFLAVGRAPSVGLVRVLAPVARADKLVLVGGAPADVPRIDPGPGGLVAWGSTDEPTRQSLLGLVERGAAAFPDLAAALLDLVPPSFALHLATRAGGGLVGVLAGDPGALQTARGPAPHRAVAEEK